MKRHNILLIAALTATLCISGCGKQDEEASSEIPNITVEAEDLPSANEETSAPEAVFIDDEEAPGEGYVRSSLTNFWVKEEIANSRPIAVMMPTDSVAQPQYGIGSAGVLYEIMEEGQISRQMAIIEGWQNLEKIGNVRSTRHYYVPVGMEWDSIIVHFGGPFYVNDWITLPGVNNITGVGTGVAGNSTPATGNEAFFRTSDKPAPHNAYTSGEKLTSAIEKQNYEKNHRSQYWTADHFKFTNSSHPNTLEDYSDASRAYNIDLSGVFPVTLTTLQYNEEEGVYYKNLHKVKQIDQLTGDQLTFTNVIVQMTDSSRLDENDYQDFTMVDSGKPGYYCTKGKMIPITWSKASNNEPTRYYDTNGNEIVLNTGKTYIAVAQTGTKPIFE
ncbi:MAG: DUF3048 domain-containing protein [Lachnospiraceae bacterium]|nr:DUF3048 domain-containing protein [Lachnospiraceae bacterium]